MNDTFTFNNTTESFLSNVTPSIDSACFGDYGTFVFAFLFFVSELMPFIQRKCSDDDAEVAPVAEGKQRKSVLEQSNGLIHLMGQLAKMKKGK